MPSPGSSSSEHFYRELSVDRGRPGGGPSVASRPVAPGSANGSEDTRDKDGKLKRTREGCYTCRNRKCVVLSASSRGRIAQLGWLGEVG